VVGVLCGSSLFPSCTYTHTLSLSCAHTHSHSHTHIHQHTHTHTHTRPLVLFSLCDLETDSARFLQEAESLEGCLLDSEEVIDNEKDSVVLITNWTQQSYSRVIQAGEEGFYNYYFVNCESDSWATFELKLVQYNLNPDGTPNYLSVGDDMLPGLYVVLFLLFLAATLLWVYVCMRAHSENPFKVKSIHHLMTVAIAVKALSLLSKAVRMRLYLFELYIYIYIYIYICVCV
jgi:hypothetical protein